MSPDPFLPLRFWCLFWVEALRPREAEVVTFVPQPTRRQKPGSASAEIILLFGSSRRRSGPTVWSGPSTFHHSKTCYYA